jgi:putative transposase
MSPVFIALLALVGSRFQTCAAQQAEIAALRHQIAVLQRCAPRRLRLKQSDRILWILLSWFWPDWRHWLHVVRPGTVVRWHRSAFARYWTWKSRRRPGRLRVAAAIRDLIQQMCQANFLWGPRIHGELRKLGIEVAPSTVGKYLRRHRKPPSQTWRNFLKNHLQQMASMDFFTVRGEGSGLAVRGDKLYRFAARQILAER